ncbi:MAG: substrate-binding domain-containing protein [Oscillospiraceae bacterium]|nr:substrate-binding domain-containing protein [Oscillospiraceae bacterium]
MKLFRQLSAIFLLAACFAAFDAAVWNAVTKRFINYASEDMQAKSIELDEYLPFDENSKIAVTESSLTLSGDLPVVDGAAALYPVFSAFVNAVYPKESVSFDGKDFASDSKLRFSNTRGAYKAIADGTADIVFCAQPSAEQLAYAEKQGVELELIPIGCEAFVFIMNKDNPVDSLTVEQVRGLYAGDFRSWSEVGGDNYPVDTVTRNAGSGSQTAMLSFMDGREMKKSPFGFLGRSIGYSFRYYVSDLAENGKIKMLSLNGVCPDKENVSNGSYPIVSNFYAVCRKDDTNPNVRIFIDWILSEEGQDIVDKSGYVRLRGAPAG